MQPNSATNLLNVWTEAEVRPWSPVWITNGGAAPQGTPWLCKLTGGQTAFGLWFGSGNRNKRSNITNDAMTRRWGPPNWNQVIKFWWKGFQAKHKMVDQWENTIHEIIEKLPDVPIYKFCKLPRPGKEYDESHPLHTRVVYWNMLFQLAWTEIDIPEDRDVDRRLSDHQACMPQGEAVKQVRPMKMLV